MFDESGDSSIEKPKVARDEPNLVGFGAVDVVGKAQAFWGAELDVFVRVKGLRECSGLVHIIKSGPLARTIA